MSRCHLPRRPLDFIFSWDPDLDTRGFLGPRGIVFAQPLQDHINSALCDGGGSGDFIEWSEEERQRQTEEYEREEGRRGLDRISWTSRKYKICEYHQSHGMMSF